MELSTHLIALAMGMAADPGLAASKLPDCATGLQPVATIAPRLPTLLHNEFRGEAKLVFVIDAAGRVVEPIIIDAHWQPVGHTRGQPVGYDQAILEAVVQWRYPPNAVACRHQISVTLRHADDPPEADTEPVQPTVINPPAHAHAAVHPRSQP